MFCKMIVLFFLNTDSHPFVHVQFSVHEMGDDIYCAHFSFKNSSNLNIFEVLSRMFFLFAFPRWSAGGLEGLLYQN